MQFYKIIKSRVNPYLIGLFAMGLFSFLIYWLELLKPAEVWKYYGWAFLDPLYMVNGGNAANVRLILSFVFLGLAYLTALRWAYKVKGRAAWVIVLGSFLAFSIAMLYMAPFGSNDIYDYISHGRIVGIYHANPYVKVGANFPQDIFTYYMGWPYAPSAYGPVWELGAGLVAKLAGNGVMQNVIAFKLYSGLYLLGSLAMVILILRRRAPKHALAGALLLAWNPVVMFEIMGNGHNDMTIVFWILLSIWALDRRFFTLSVLSLVAGVLIKYIPVLMIPAVGLIALRLLPSNKARIRFIVVTAVLSIALVAISYAPFWEGLKTLSINRRTSLFTSSLASVVYNVLADKIGKVQAASDVSKLAALATFAFALYQSYRAWKKPTVDRYIEAAFLIFTFYLLFAVLWFWTWYTVWLIGLVPLIQNKRMRNLAILFAFSAMSKHLTLGPLVLWPRTPVAQPLGEFWLMVGMMGPAWIYLLYLLLKDRVWEGWSAAIFGEPMSPVEVPARDQDGHFPR